MSERSDLAELTAETLLAEVFDAVHLHMHGDDDASRRVAEGLYLIGHHPDRLVATCALGRLVHVVKVQLCLLEDTGTPHAKLFIDLHHWLAGPAEPGAARPVDPS